MKPGKTEKLIRKVWEPSEVRKLARQLADIAAEVLTPADRPVRRPGSERTAANILRKRSAPDLLSLVREISDASLALSHPRYGAQQVAAPIPAATLVESVVAAMNQSLAVWEMSPIATAIDRDLIANFKKLFGYPRTADGSLVPGGAFANLTALLAARDALEPRSSRTGKARIAIIVGSQAHYSIARAAAVLGLGRAAVFKADLDSEFCTDVAQVDNAFAKARKAGFRKFILVGSSGSTPTGSFDNLEALADIARKHRAWFHVDAAHGAGLLFSRKFRRRLKGISRADSIVFDPHKMMFMPLAAGGVMVRDRKKLLTPLQEQAPYLFGSKRRWPDLGQITIACSQRFDALKAWLVCVFTDLSSGIISPRTSATSPTPHFDTAPNHEFSSLCTNLSRTSFVFGSGVPTIGLRTHVIGPSKNRSTRADMPTSARRCSMAAECCALW